MKNREVAGVLRELADTMELLGEDRYRVANYRDAATRVEHHHEPIGIAVRQRPQQHRACQAEDGRVHAETERKRDDCNKGNARASSERTHWSRVCPPL